MPKPRSQKAPKGHEQGNMGTITDPRFANIQSDPRFRLPSKKHTHVKVDKRFSHMLRDEDFTEKTKVDRYGRRLAKGSRVKELERLYNIGDDDSEEEGGEGAESGEDDEVVRSELSRVEGRPYDPARDGGFSSSDESESSSEDEVEPEDLADPDPGGALGIPDALMDAQQKAQSDVPMGSATSRLAVVNLDWDNIRAVDLMAVFSSFCPPSGRILKIAVYPSEFGKERMEKEETEGPPRELFQSGESKPNLASDSVRNGQSRQIERDEKAENDQGKEEDDEDEKIKKNLVKEDEGNEFDSAALRAYQIQRLRYFYAVITCSSPATGKALYDATDGTEYLTSANFFDLRFIPDEVDFDGDDNDKRRDECDMLPEGYKPNEFVTDALQHSRVRLTWDEEDKTRKNTLGKAFAGGRKEIEENDLKAYLGSDSSEDDGEADPSILNTDSNLSQNPLSKKEQERLRLRAALGLSTKPALSASSKPKSSTAPVVGDMQVTFTSGLSAHDAEEDSVFTNKPPETTVESYVRREKERKARRKEKLKAAREQGGTTAVMKRTAEETESNDKDAHTAAEPSLPADEDNTETQDLGFNDPFFATAFPDSSTATATKPSKSERKAERLARRAARDAETAEREKQRAELELLMVADEDEAGGVAGAGAGAGARTQHFDMREIERAEKLARRRGGKGKKGKKKKRDGEGEGEAGAGAGEAGAGAEQQEGFALDTADPRFAALYESHEYAIDPTNPKFRPTAGMTRLLEEGRRRKRGGEGEGGEVVEGKRKKRRGEREREREVMDLVEKVRRRAEVEG